MLGDTAVVLGGLAILLDSGEVAAEKPAAIPPRAGREVSGLAVGLATVGALGLFFFVSTRPNVTNSVRPDLLALLPAEADGWRVNTSTDLYQFSGVLKSDILAQRTYQRQEGDRTLQLTVYLAYWQPGQSSVSQVAMHTPDACWPGSGWAAVPEAAANETLVIGDHALPPAEARKFMSGRYPQFVWFWHLYDGRPIRYEDPYSAVRLLEIALRHGFTRDGNQFFVRVSSNLPWTEQQTEPLVADIIHRLAPLGL